jgi:1-acyl-sn-glycerol-3-phosphate acyltransferase
VLARETGCLLVPVAHDAGRYWPRRGLFKKSGRIRLVIGRPIPATGLDPREVNERAQAWIESTLRSLQADPARGAT